MASFTLRQGDVIAQLSEAWFRPAQGFEEDNTWHVSEESIWAQSDSKLRDGPATLQHGGSEFPVTVTVLEFETLPGEDDEPEKGEPACLIEIGYADPLQKLALDLGLIEQPPAKQRRPL